MTKFEIGDWVYSYQMQAYGEVMSLFPTMQRGRSIVQHARIMRLLTTETRFKYINVPITDLRMATPRDRAVIVAQQALGVT